MVDDGLFAHLQSQHGCMLCQYKLKKQILLIDEMSVPFKKKWYVWGDDNDGTNCFNADSRNETLVFLLAL